MPPVEEGLIVPNFETAAEEPRAVVPPGFRDEIGMALPEPTPPRPRTRFDPEGQGPRQGMSFGENFQGTLGSGTIEGALDEAEALRIARGGVPMPETDAIGVGSGFVPELTMERAEAARAAARDMVLQQILYDTAPTNITPRSVAGSILGQVAAPSNLLGFGGGVAARALGARGFGATAQAAATMGIRAGATDLAVQGIRTTSGDQEHFEPLEAVLAPVAGAMLGAGVHAAGQAIGKAAGGVAEFVRSRRAQRDALGIDLPREALPGASDVPREQSEAVAGSLDRIAPAEAALRAAEPARGMPTAESDPAAPVSREQADGRAEGTGGVSPPAAGEGGVEAAAVDAPVVIRDEPVPAPPIARTEPPPFKARTRAEWDNIRPAAAPDAPAWAPKVQSTLDELARGFDMEPPRVSVAKPKFDDAPLFGMNDRQGNILLAEGMSEHHALNNAVHEFGHEVQFRLYDAAPAQTQDAIQAAFRAATARDAGTTSLNQLRPVTATRKLGDAGQPKRIKYRRTGDEPIPAGSAAAGYQHSFEEWFAEQVSRWVTQDAKPVGVVERFFSGVADAWRKIYAKVAGHTPLDAEVKAFLDGRWQGSEAGRVTREPAPKFTLAPADHDELGMVKPGKVDDRVYRILRDGEPVGYTNVRVDGERADVRDIFTHLGGGNIDLSRGVFGPRAMSQIMQQFLAENPGVKRLTGERTSGARRGGKHGLLGTGEQVDISIPARRVGPVADLEQTLVARGIDPPSAPGLLTSPETSLVEAATRLHGAPAERTIPLDELRAAVPGQSTADLDLTLAALRERGVAKVTDRGVTLDHAGVRQVQEATERYVRAEAEEVGELLFRRRAPAKGIEEPDQIRQGRPVEDQGTAPIEGDARPERLEALGTRFAADFETILRTGRVQAGARGQFSTSTGVARVRSLADLDTTIHEIGHSLQQSPQTRAVVDPVVIGNRGELAPLGAGTGETGDAEAFAELFRLYATNRAYAERTYPNATADLERTLREGLPVQAAALDRLRADLDVIHRADSGAVVGSDVITPKPDGLFARILDVFGADFLGAAATDPRGGVYYAWRDALYTRLLSPHHPLNRAMDALGRVFRENTGKTLDLLPQDHAYILARVGSGANVTAQSMLEHGVRGARSDTATGASFRDAIEAAIGKRYTSGQWHDFGAYLTARSMVADYERFAAGEIPNPPGKLSAGDYARAVQEFDAKFPTFADGAEKFYEFNTNLLQRHYDKGLFTKEYLDASLARKDYAPKLRDMEDLGTSALTGGGARRDGASMMKTFRGSQRSVLNPLDSTVKKVYDLEQAAALNDTKAALARLAEIAGPGSGFIAEPIPANKLSSVRIDVVDALRAAGSRANVDSLDLGALIHQAEGMLGDDVFAHVFRQEPIRPGQEPITFYYVNGERRALRLADDAFGRELHTALNAMTTPERNIFLSVLQISGAVLRQGVTKSLGFIYRNFTRDQGTSVATGARGYIPFITALQGGFDVVRGGGDFEKYLSFGGFAGGVIHEAVEGSALARGGAQRMFREKNVVSRLLGAGAKAAELSEAATRAGQFQSYVKQAKDLGFDAYNASLYATFKANDYIDFRKVGSHMATVSRWVPFLNASAQGTDKEARALIGDMVRLEGKRARGEELSRIEADSLKDSRAAWVKTMAWGMIFGGGVAYLNSEDPEWFGAAAWRRDRGYNLTKIGPDGNWLSFPKPFGLVRNVSDLFEYGVEYMMRSDPTIAAKLGNALAEAHHLPYSNPFIDTFYGARANYDAFRDRPIVPPSLQALPPSEQYTRYTSEIAKGIGQVTGWSPMKVDYAAKNLGGGTAIDFLRNADSLIHWMQDKPGGKAKTIWDLPLARELVQNLSVGAEATTRFYGLVGQKAGTLEQAATAYGQKIATGDRTGAESYLRGLPANERAYATLQKQGFDASDKLLHPLVLARAYNAVIAGVSRAIGDRNLIPEGDLDRSSLTLSRRDAKPIEVDGPTGEKLRNALDAYAMVTARNALIAFGADGMQGVPVKDPAEFLDRIKILSPDVARELRGRLAAKRLYDPAVVAERWPEAKARLLKDGENADLSDLLPRQPKSGNRERKRAMSDE
ncbi:hypothetical protein FV232_19790 [Methylobacterium sp. WL30]|uniref:LPD38 domain-containing protein n=1 Tax=unclassified Methylobacterium TaxID=2615210 RepID=UPI0011CC111B|nr:MULTISPECIES: LPD38 domain-containing protein [unclassified Methylobacterium]TXN41411.1 hypothetical protein FV225_02675 [Methylobacterium sp. WL93]TXN49793.1 hypothetical protein FV227_14965 [Methylobacterium sp. WL119]TXN64868.1 hypothetical protein FV232_19790 [Methylobacterium sp. WL30]